LSAVGSLEEPLPPAWSEALRQHLIINIRGMRPEPVARAIRAAVPEGLRLGADDGGGATRLRPSSQLRQAVSGIDQGMQSRITQAIAYLRHARLQTYGDYLAVHAQLTKAANRADAAAAWIAHRSVNEGVSAAAVEGTPNPVVWLPERGACATCLAYAGDVVWPGEMFPPGKTFGDSSTVQVPIPGPPAHPFCRCELKALRPDDDGSYSLSLKREAQRSVLQGNTLGSEPARIRATERLLARAGSLLVPKTVVKRARERVEAGRR
jgi:hypothetical protein